MSWILPPHPVRVRGMGTHTKWLTPTQAPAWPLPAARGLLELSAADFVVTVCAATPLADLQAELATQGLSLPIPADPIPGWDAIGTVGGLVAMGLPHRLESSAGPIRDWVCGLRLLRPGGDDVRVGAKVVKSVAGFDLHRALTGARGLGAVITEVTLRVHSSRREFPCGLVWLKQDEAPNWIGRCPLSRIADWAAATPSALAYDPGTGTLWSREAPPTWPETWGLGPQGARWPDSPWEARARQAFDPDGRLIDGWI